MAILTPVLKPILSPILSPIFVSDSGGGGGEDLLTDLFAYWDLDETSGHYADSHTNNYVLNAYNTPGTTTGVKGNAMTVVNVSNEYAMFTQHYSLVPERLGGVTMAGWIKLNTAYTNNRGLFSQSTTTVANSPFSLRTSTSGGNGNVRLYAVDSGNNFTATVFATGFSLDTWYHVAVVFNPASGGSASVVVNGSTYYSVTTNCDGIPYDVSTTLNTYVGRAYDISGPDCAYDEFGVWDTALTQAQLTWLYNGGAGRTYSEINP
jgi:hypothetical protein